MARLRDEHGSGSVLALAVAAVVLLVLGALLPMLLAFGHRSRVAGAADAAALAAADAAVGRSPGAPCAEAARVAAANGAELAACSLDGLVATVTATTSVLGLPLGATATAGPPPENRPP